MWFQKFLSFASKCEHDILHEQLFCKRELVCQRFLHVSFVFGIVWMMCFAGTVVYHTSDCMQEFVVAICLLRLRHCIFGLYDMSIANVLLRLLF